MLSTKKEIKEYIEKTKFFKDCKIVWVKSGLSNRNYFFKSSGKKYILRINIPRSGGKIKPLKNEHLLLKFLKIKKNRLCSSFFLF
jgi:Ser/Thr protein kinase RdoA (MazF antagonist)